MFRAFLTSWLTGLLALAHVGAALAASPQLAATMLDGRQTTGELRGWHEDRVILANGEESIELPLAELLSIRPALLKPGGEPASYVEFTDGTTLPLDAYTAAEHRASIKSPLAAEPIELATEQVRLVQFSPRALESAAFWSDLEADRLSGDALVVQQNDGGPVEHLAGMLGDITADQVNFNWDGEDIPVKRAKVVALAYYHGKPSEWPQARCLLTTSGGAKLPVKELTWDAPAQSLRVTTIGDVQVTVPLEELREANYSFGKLAYLSDLKPVRVEWTPRIALPPAAMLVAGYGLPRKDQSFSGSSLTLHWPVEGTAGPGEVKTFAKGLALRSRTELEYRIPSGMSRLSTIAGIDPATASQGNVSLEISADDSVLWQGEIDGRGAPVEINVTVPKSRRLKVIVDYGGNLDYGDRLHLVEARFTK